MGAGNPDSNPHCETHRNTPGGLQKVTDSHKIVRPQKNGYFVTEFDSTL